MKNLFYIYLLSFINFSFCQKSNIQVSYTTILNDTIDYYGVLQVESGKLNITNNYSYYHVEPKDTLVYSNFYGDYTKTSDYSFEYIRKLNESCFLYEDGRGGYKSKKIIKDFIDFNWELKEVFKTIKGYKCQLASTNFRGRNYEAYFTREIPVNSGPFKFYGLPGLILEIKSKEGSVNIFVNEIKFNQAFIENYSYTNATTITFEKFLKNYKIFFDKIINFKSDIESEIFIPKRYIEYFIYD